MSTPGPDHPAPGDAPPRRDAAPGPADHGAALHAPGPEAHVPAGGADGGGDEAALEPLLGSKRGLVDLTARR